MAETPAFFEMTPSKCIVKKGDCVVCSSGGEKVTVLLSANKCQQMLPPMIIFEGKTDQTIRNLIIPPGFIVKTHEKP